jgi:hypothetical protein
MESLGAAIRAGIFREICRALIYQLQSQRFGSVRARIFVGPDAGDGPGSSPGFDGPFLSALCDPEQSLAIGCKVLRKKFDTASGDCTRALQAWNGGGNAEYAAQVLARRSLYL